jgi:hypothetical protein
MDLPQQEFKQGKALRIETSRFVWLMLNAESPITEKSINLHNTIKYPMNYLTFEQAAFISESNSVSLESANATLEKQIKAELKSTLSNLPDGKETDSYIDKLTTMKIHEFKSGLNKALHSLAHEVISKRKSS